MIYISHSNGRSYNFCPMSESHTLSTIEWWVCYIIIKHPSPRLCSLGYSIALLVGMIFFGRQFTSSWYHLPLSDQQFPCTSLLDARCNSARLALIQSRTWRIAPGAGAERAEHDLYHQKRQIEDSKTRPMFYAESEGCGRFNNKLEQFRMEYATPRAYPGAAHNGENKNGKKNMSA